MIPTIKLESAKFPKVIADLIHSNQFLKMFSIIACALAVISIVAIIVAMTRPPTVLAFSPSAQILDAGSPPKLEDEVRIAVLKYIELRYKWDPATVKDQLKAAEGFVSPPLLTAYKKAADNVAKFSQDKQVAQRVYPSPPTISLETKRVFITGDRITSVQGIRAAGELKLELDFDVGARTKANPWGVFVTKEIEN